MMRVERHAVTEAADWLSVVEACDGNALHLPAVHQAEFTDDEIHLLTFHEGERVLGCAVGCEARAGRLRGLLGRTHQLVLPTSPATANPAVVPDIRAALLRYGHERGFDRLILHPTYSLWIGGDEDLIPYRSDSITEFIIDLRPGTDAVFARMHKTHRKNARRAERAGLKIEEDHSLEGLLRLRQLQLASAQRASERTEGFSVGDEDQFRRLHERVYAPGIGHVLFAYLDSEPLAALAWIQAARRVQTVRSGSMPEGYETRAMYYLYTELITRSIEQGMVELNAGGVPADARDADHPQSGLYEFKSGFGGSPVSRHGLNIPLEKVSG